MRVEERGVIYDASCQPDGRRVASFVGLCPLDSGSFLCTYQVGPCKHAPSSTLGFCRSDDGGRTWRELPVRLESTLDGIPGSLAAGEIVEVEPVEGVRFKPVKLTQFITLMPSTRTCSFIPSRILKFLVRPASNFWKY